MSLKKKDKNPIALSNENKYGDIRKKCKHQAMVFSYCVIYLNDAIDQSDQSLKN